VESLIGGDRYRIICWPVEADQLFEHDFPALRQRTPVKAGRRPPEGIGLDGSVACSFASRHWAKDRPGGPWMPRLVIWSFELQHRHAATS
jgi:hypothetical protein